MRDLARLSELIEHNALRRDHACTGKVAYAHPNHAKHAAKLYGRSRERQMFTYKCPFSGHWHIAKVKYGEEAA